MGKVFYEMKKKGFTLIELIVVIAVIAIIAFIIKALIGDEGIYLPDIDLSLVAVIVIVIFIVVAYFVINTEIGWDPIIALMLAAVALVLCMAFISGYAADKNKEYSKGEVTQLMWRSTTKISYEYNDKTYYRTVERSGDNQEVCIPQYEMYTYETADTSTEYYVTISNDDGDTIYAINEYIWKDIWNEKGIGKEIKYKCVVDSVKKENQIVETVW